MTNIVKNVIVCVHLNKYALKVLIYANIKVILW